MPTGLSDNPEISDIAVKGHIAFVSAGVGGLRVLDIANPEAPTEIASVDTQAYGLNYAGDTLYVASGTGALRIYDISQGTSPALQSELQLAGYPLDAEIAGNIALVPAALGGLRILSVEDPIHPVELTSMSFESRFPLPPPFPPQYASVTDVDLVGSIAYVMAEHRLQIVDISTPQSPTILGSALLAQSGRSVRVSGHYAFIAGFPGLMVVDVSDPRTPAVIATVDVVSNVPGGPARDLEISDKTVWMIVERNGLLAIDVSDPARPRRRGYLAVSAGTSPPYGAQCITLGGSNILVGGNGVRIIDASEPDFPAEIGRTQINGIVDIEVHNGLGFVGLAHQRGLSVLDLHDPQHITQIGYLDLPDVPDQIRISGSVLQVSVLNQGLLAVDVSDPTHPHEIGRFSLYPVAFDTDDGMAYLANTGCRNGKCGTTLTLVDISEPHSPAQRSSLFFESTSETGIGVGDGVAVIKTGSQGLRFVDVTSATDPVVYGNYRIQISGFWDWLVADNLFLATDFYNLHALNISSIAAPSSLGVTRFSDAAAITLGDKKRYALIAWDDEVAVIDLQDPTRPRRLGGSPGYGGIALDVSDGLVYTADTSYLRIIDFGPEYRCNADASDLDCDGVGISEDVCPDFDQIASIDSDSNGIGDECECADQTQDGLVNVMDIMSMSGAILGRERTSPLCDGNNDSRCNVSDMVAAHQRMFGTPAYCSRYPPPGP